MKEKGIIGGAIIEGTIIEKKMRREASGTPGGEGLQEVPKHNRNAFPLS